jgi:hypothetical protein
MRVIPWRRVLFGIHMVGDRAAHDRLFVSATIEAHVKYSNSGGAVSLGI